MKKFFIGFLLLLIAVLLLLNWAAIYQSLLVPLAKDGTLAPLITIISVFIAFSSFIIALITFKNTRWNAQINLVPCYVSYGEILEVNKTVYKSKKGRVYDPDDFIPKTRKIYAGKGLLRSYMLSDGDLADPYKLELFKLEVRNLGKENLKFKGPKVTRKRRYGDDIEPIFYRKNNEIHTLKENWYSYEVSSGDTVEFFYAANDFISDPYKSISIIQNNGKEKILSIKEKWKLKRGQHSLFKYPFDSKYKTGGSIGNFNKDLSDRLLNFIVQEAFTGIRDTGLIADEKEPHTWERWYKWACIISLSVVSKYLEDNRRKEPDGTFDYEKAFSSEVDSPLSPEEEKYYCAREAVSIDLQHYITGWENIDFVKYHGFAKRKLSS